VESPLSKVNSCQHFYSRGVTAELNENTAVQPIGMKVFNCNGNSVDEHHETPSIFSQDFVHIL